MKYILAGLVFFSTISFFSFGNAQVPTCQASLLAKPPGPFPCSVTLVWTDNSNNELTFPIERQVNGGPFTALHTVGANVTTYTDATLAQSATVDNTYCYRVAAANVSLTGVAQQSAWTTDVACTPLIPKVPTPILPPKSASGLMVK